MYRYHKGFTLVELLVVLAIISIIMSILIISYTDARIQARYMIAEQSMRQIIGALDVAYAREGGTVMRITGSVCTMCPCRDYNQDSGYPLWTVRDDSPPGNAFLANQCLSRWRSALEEINAKSSGLALDTDGLLFDPWGSPYLLDENELEYASDPCRRDWLRSAGRDGIKNTSDDYVIRLPFRSAQCIEADED